MNKEEGDSTMNNQYEHCPACNNSTFKVTIIRYRAIPKDTQLKCVTCGRIIDID